MGNVTLLIYRIWGSISPGWSGQGNRYGRFKAKHRPDFIDPFKPSDKQLPLGIQLTTSLRVLFEDNPGITFLLL